MTLHLSTRIVWHDRGWDGCVCDNPAKNVYCIGQFSVGSEFIRQNKDVDWEQSRHGKPCLEVWANEKRMPPCTWTIGAYSASETPVRHVHPFIGNARPREEEFPAYSVGTWSFDQMYDRHTGNPESL